MGIARLGLGGGLVQGKFLKNLFLKSEKNFLVRALRF